eukprot:8115847-Pyramimonas_sp.AAC.1
MLYGRNRGCRQPKGARKSRGRPQESPKELQGLTTPGDILNGLKTPRRSQRAQYHRKGLRV